MISDSESVQSEVILQDRPTLSQPSTSTLPAPISLDSSTIFANNNFASHLQKQIDTSIAPLIASLTSIAASISQPGNPGVSHSPSG